MTLTLNPLSNTLLTTSEPGSEIKGYPASETKATSRPSSSAVIIFSVADLSLCW